MDAFDILGITPAASTDEVDAAWRGLAKQFHPDRFPEADTEGRKRLNDAMARINAAHSALKDPAQRAAIIRERTTPSPNRPAQRGPVVGECDLCGSAPAEQFTFRHQTAWLIGAQQWRIDAELCRDCAMAFGRAKQNRTLLTGWWGVLSFFRNLGIIAGNASGLSRAGRMRAPQRDQRVVTPLTSPLPQGKPLLARAGVWVTAIAIAGLGVVAVNDAQTSGANTSNSNASSYRPPAAAAQREATWAVGSCITGSSMVEPVPCSSYHTGRIVGRTTSPQLCDASTESYVEDGAIVWCIDEDV
jgi:hypothetical protein